VRRDAGTSAPRSAETLRYEEVHDHRTLVPSDGSGLPPDADLSTSAGEPCRFERILQQGSRGKDARVDCQVCIRRVGGHGESTQTGAQVDRLRPYEHDGLPMVAESLQRVEEDVTRGYV
jgi:hypothetical protein